MNNVPSDTRLVWYALVNKDGKPFKETTTTCISMNVNCIVREFSQTLVKRCNEEKCGLLNGINSSQLLVFSNMGSFANRNNMTRHNLEPSSPLAGLGTTEETALVVLVPTLSSNTGEWCCPILECFLCCCSNFN
jgi:hypothetical protein